MNNLRKRLIFDVLLTALLVFEMLFQLTGDFLHEAIGMVFFVTIVVHLILSRKWIGVTSRSIAQGKKLKAGNTVRMVMGIALGMTSLVLMASSLAISNVLYGFGIGLAGGAYAAWVAVHTASSYLLCCLVACHLAIHWASVAAGFRIPYNRDRRAAISAGVTALAALGVAAIGLRGTEALGAAVAAVDEGASSDAAAPSAPELTTQDTPAPSTGAAATASRTRSQEKHSRSNSSASTASASQFDATDSTSSSTESSATGICTLCPKKCPLSNPKCNKPYAVGLI